MALIPKVDVFSFVTIICEAGQQRVSGGHTQADGWPSEASLQSMLSGGLIQGAGCWS